MLIGYARVSKADGSKSLDLQRDALPLSKVANLAVADDRFVEPFTHGEGPYLQRPVANLLGHAPLLAQLGAGELWYRSGTTPQHLAVAFVEV